MYYIMAPQPENYIESEINKKSNMKNKKSNIKNETINMNSSEKEQYKKDIKEKFNKKRTNKHCIKLRFSTDCPK